MTGKTGVNDIGREMKLRELKEQMKKLGWTENEQEQTCSEKAAAPENQSRQEECNEVYTIRGAIVKGKNEVRTYGEHGDGSVQAVAFAYRIKGREDVFDAVLVADVWNDTLRYNAFEIGEEYDLDLRLSGRQGRDGRWFGGVSVQRARRVWMDGELGRK